MNFEYSFCNPVSKQNCLEGKWTYSWEDEHPDYIRLDVSVPKHLSTSLIDVDVHPTFITIIIKSKILRLKLPEEVKSEESKAQRSTITGHLLITMPRINSAKTRNRILDSYKHKHLSNPIPQAITNEPKNNQKNTTYRQQASTDSPSSSRRIGIKQQGLFYEMVQESCRNTNTFLSPGSASSKDGNMATPNTGKMETYTASCRALLSEETNCSNVQETQTARNSGKASSALLQDECDDEPPPLL